MNRKAPMKYKFEQDFANGLPRNSFETKDGNPVAICIHWTGNEKSYKSGEIAYMKNNWQSAFVHAYADYTGVTETANTDYIAWGAGPAINGWALHIEFVHADTKEQFYKALDFYIFWIAYNHYYYDMGKTVDNAENDGWGTLWTHNAVSKHLGGTDHVDPMDYFSRWGITLNQIVDKIQDYVTELYKDEKGNSALIPAIGEGKYITTVKGVSKTNVKPKIASKKKAPPKPSVVTKSLVPETYIMKENDTLYKVAKKYQLNVDDLISFNKSLDIKNIPIGAKINLKKPITEIKKEDKPTTYKVKVGDTLWDITQNHNIDLKDLMAWNNKKSGLINKDEVLRLTKPVPKKSPVKKEGKEYALLTKDEAVKFAESNVGQYIDFDGVFQFQCYDWANCYWWKLFKKALQGPYAETIPFDNKEMLSKQATIIKKTSDNKPEPGDLVILDWNPNDHEDGGHVLVCIESGKNGMTIIEQNTNGKGNMPVVKRVTNFNGITYMIRPNFKK